MKTKLTLRPGKRGTKRLTAQYGDKLVCIRYRYDEQKKRRLKTVEIIVEETPWEPKFLPTAIVSISIAYSEIELRTQAKAAGAEWDSKRKLWKLKYAAASKLGLRRRIVTETEVVPATQMHLPALTAAATN